MSESTILQLRVELLNIEPRIWRPLQVPRDYTFWRPLQVPRDYTFWGLHVAIQSVFGWNDSYLHESRPWDRQGLR